MSVIIILIIGGIDIRNNLRTLNAKYLITTYFYRKGDPRCLGKWWKAGSSSKYVCYVLKMIEQPSSYFTLSAFILHVPRACVET